MADLKIIDLPVELRPRTKSLLHHQIQERQRACDEAEMCETCLGTGLGETGKPCRDCQGMGLISTW